MRRAFLFLITTLVLLSGACTVGESVRDRTKGMGGNAASGGNSATEADLVPSVEPVTRKWGDVTTLGNAAGDASEVHVVADGAGLLAVWAQRSGIASNVYASRYDVASGWNTPSAIAPSADGPRRSSRVRLATDGRGNALAIWLQSEGVETHLWANRHTRETGWASAQRIDATDVGDLGGPELAMGGDGSAFAVWSAYDGTRYNVIADRYVPGSGWGTASLIPNRADDEARSIAVAEDGSGDALAVWTQQIGNRYEIHANRFVAMTGWGVSSAVQLAPDQDESFPQVTVGAGGRATIAWRETDPDGVDRVWAVATEASGAFSTASRIAASGVVGFVADLQLAQSNGGMALAVWSQSDGAHQKIFASHQRAAGDWSPAVPLGDYSPGDAGSPRIAFDAKGDAWVVWVQSDGGQSQILVSRYFASRGFGGAERIDGGNGNARDPQIVIDADGNVAVVWIESDAAGTSVRARQFR